MINFIKRAWRGDIENQLYLGIGFIILEITLLVCCGILVPIEISPEGTLLNIQQNTEQFKNVYLLTFPVQIWMVISLIRGIKIQRTEKGALTRKSVQSISIALGFIFPLLTIFFINAF